LIDINKGEMWLDFTHVYQTYADTQDLFKAANYTPKISVKEGWLN